MAGAWAAMLISETCTQVLRETEDPFRYCNVFKRDYDMPLPTYRERLDRRIVNYYGEIVPRIVIVRRNLRLLGSVRLNPARIR